MWRQNGMRTGAEWEEERGAPRTASMPSNIFLCISSQVGWVSWDLTCWTTLTTASLSLVMPCTPGGERGEERVRPADGGRGERGGAMAWLGVDSP